jgi:hypothetical protein
MKHGRRKTVARYQIGIIPMLVEVLLAVFFALEPVREPAERLSTWSLGFFLGRGVLVLELDPAAVLRWNRMFGKWVILFVTLVWVC